MLALAVGAAEVTAEHEAVPAWVFGLVTFLVLLLLLFVVTRFDPDR